MMVISRRRQLHHPIVKLVRKITYDSSLSILKEIDGELTFAGRVKHITALCARRSACLRRTAHYLDAEGCKTLHNSQIGLVTEY